jgi:hypothetical protein
MKICDETQCFLQINKAWKNKRMKKKQAKTGMERE